MASIDSIESIIPITISVIIYVDDSAFVAVCVLSTSHLCQYKINNGINNWQSIALMYSKEYNSDNA